MLSTTYLGYGAEMKPLTHGRVEKVLDKEVQGDNGKHITEKEWVLYKLVDRYKPGLIENYQRRCENFINRGNTTVLT